MSGGGITLSNQGLIAGQGTIGNNGLSLANSGTINSNVSGGTVTLNGGGTFSNTGLFEATNGATLQLNNIITNTGGNITANGAGSIVNIATTINGGTLNAINGGTIQTNPEGTATLNGVTISTGTTYINGNNANVLVNGLTDNGNFQIAAGASSSIMEITGDTTLNGTGVVTLSQTGGGGSAVIEMNGGGITLTNPGLIVGQGVIGNNGLSLINSGTINSNVSGGTLTLNGGGAFTNTGLFEATNGATLQINNNINNAGGNITANGAGSIVNIATTINGGTLNAINGGTIQTNPEGTATLNGVTISTGNNYINGNNANVLVNGLTDNGNFQIAAGAQVAP